MPRTLLRDASSLCRSAQAAQEHPEPTEVGQRRARLVLDSPRLSLPARPAGVYGRDCEHLIADSSVKQGQLKDYEARIGKPFAHEAYKDELESLRDQLKPGLSEHPPEGLPPVAGLAERVKTLREANSVGAAPERVGTREAVKAERPVTARIRERIGSLETEAADEAAQVHVRRRDPSGWGTLPG